MLDKTQITFTETGIMNTEIITEAARATISGDIPFPEIVRRLIETGVEYYHVDYVALRMTY